MIRHLPLSGRFFTWFILNRLRSLEKQIVACIWAMKNDFHPTTLLGAELHLAQKAVASAISTLLLLSHDFRQEAEGPQRSFLESWIFMMHFAWFPGSGAQAEWARGARTDRIALHYKIKKAVEETAPTRLGLIAPAYVPIQEMFRILSNTAVHPTLGSAQRAWEDAVWRIRFRLPKDVEKEIETPRYNAFAFSLVLFLSQLHLFAKFLRVEVLGRPEIPRKYRCKQISFMESLLGQFLDRFIPAFKNLVEDAKREMESKGIAMDDA